MPRVDTTAYDQLTSQHAHVFSKQRRHSANTLGGTKAGSSFTDHHTIQLGDDSQDDSDDALALDDVMADNSAVFTIDSSENDADESRDLESQQQPQGFNTLEYQRANSDGL